MIRGEGVESVVSIDRVHKMGHGSASKERGILSWASSFLTSVVWLVAGCSRHRMEGEKGNDNERKASHQQLSTFIELESDHAETTWPELKSINQQKRSLSDGTCSPLRAP